MTREVGLGLSSGRPTPVGLAERPLAGDSGLDSLVGRGRLLGRGLWSKGVRRLLWGLLVVLVVIFPASASLAKSFSTSERMKAQWHKVRQQRKEKTRKEKRDLNE